MHESTNPDDKVAEWDGRAVLRGASPADWAKTLPDAVDRRNITSSTPVKKSLRGSPSIALRALMLIASVALSSLSSVGIAAEGPLSIPKQYSAHAAKLSPAETADRIAGHILEKGTLPSGLASALPLESLLTLYDVTGDEKYLNFVKDSVRRYSDPDKLNTFSSIGYSLFLRTMDPRDMGPFVVQAREDRKSLLRAFDGAVSFYQDEFSVLKQDGGDIHLNKDMTPIFVDHLAEYSSRMARAGWLTGEDDFHKEALLQILIFRSALRDFKTGLWAHGRGWYGTSRDVNDTKWARGHAWLLHAFSGTLPYLPPSSPEFKQVSGMLNDLANVLLHYQDKEGFWHQVLDRPESFQETSATGLISYYYARAIRQGYLPKERFEAASRRGYEALSKHRISSSGVVYGGVMSTPPLMSTEQYMSRATPVQDPHAVGAAILAAAGQLLLEGKGRILPAPLPAH